jgi:hypothetical protein
MMRYVALDSANQLVDGGKQRSIEGWKRRARRRMPQDLKRCGFKVAVFVAGPEHIELRGFEYVRVSYAK